MKEVCGLAFLQVFQACLRKAITTEFSNQIVYNQVQALHEVKSIANLWKNSLNDKSSFEDWWKYPKYKLISAFAGFLNKLSH